MSVGKRYVCIHGHFYQPPREDPWSGCIPRQPSAAPDHDWNARVHRECYRPNGAVPAAGAAPRNNYERISFNFGPTLLAWMETADPRTYEAIRAADRESIERLGHGNALAQVYNHMILPLAHGRDRRTQVRWGVLDFRRRFGRRPAGMWLPEAAVDVESLEIVAAEGLSFTILAPEQAARVRPPGGEWRDVGDGSVDPSRPYTVRLPSGSGMTVFFYDGPVSRAVAFEELANHGEELAERLREGLSDGRARDQLLHIATDGETYGHHRSDGARALAGALDRLQRAEGIRLTNYAAFLAQHPPSWEAEVRQPSSWSCPHGVDRWWRDCGCHTGRHTEWTQAWRTPLRNAFDWLRDSLAPRYEEMASALLHDPWGARDDSVKLLLDPTPESKARFLGEHGRAACRAPEGTRRALTLLEMQRNLMLMYTSCGWFFEDLAGIETVQVIAYAARAAELAAAAGAGDLQEGLRSRLAEARSNRPDGIDGAALHDRCLRAGARRRRAVRGR